MKITKRINNIFFLSLIILFNTVFMYSKPEALDKLVVYVNHNTNQNQKEIITQSNPEKHLQFIIEKEKKYLRQKQSVEIINRVIEDQQISGSSAVSMAVVNGTLNDRADSSGYIEVLAEVKNTGTVALTHPEVTINFYNSSNALIASEYAPIVGGTIVKIFSFYGNAIFPGQSGFFKVYTWTNYSDVDHYSLSFNLTTGYNSIANTNLSFAGTPTVGKDSSGNVEIIGAVKNNNDFYMTYYTLVRFALYDAAGKVIDVDTATVNGPTVGSNTLTIQPGATEPFHLTTETPFSKYSSYKYAFDFGEILVEEPTIDAVISLNQTYFHFWSGISEDSFTISNSGTGTFNWTVTDDVDWMKCTPASGSDTGTVTITIDRSGLSPGSYSGIITISSPNAINSPQTILVTMGVEGGGDGEPYIELNHDDLIFGTVNGVNTPPQKVLISNSGTGTLNWVVTENTSWLKCYPLSGTGSGTITISIDESSEIPDNPPRAHIIITDAYRTDIGENIIVTLHNHNATDGPFGEFSTPIDGSNVSSSIPVTGWALDDIGVESVKIYRGEPGALIYLGDAVLVDGARPDVEDSYQGTPLNYQAGWGYMMLTNFLPGGGNGTFKIHAIAVDIEGHQKTLGTKTIFVDNANAVKPFGAIDTPGQGDLASGNRFINWGWVLTPQPNSITTDGSTIKVYVDGINLGNPKYNIYREDIATLFPSYANSNGAIGYFSLDTTKYSNGVHTIQWYAKDSGGNSDGIGSRYFTIQNSGDSSYHATQSNYSRFTSQQIADIPIMSNSPLKFIQGIDKNKRISFIRDNGISIIKIKELELVELQLTGNEIFVSAYLWSGNKLQSLPIGSTLKNGIFSWIPGPGFINDYRIMFLVKTPEGTLSKREVVIRVEPKFLNR